MPKYDPRYLYPRGYEIGNTALGLADLLGQGFDRMHRWDQDAQGQENNQRDYLMRLQQFMAQNEDRDLDRGIKQEALGVSRDTRAAAAQKAKDEAGIAATGRSGIAKLLKMPSTVEEMSAPPPEFAADPERLQPNILQALTKRPATRDDAMGGLAPDEAGHKDVADLLLKLFPQPKEPSGDEYASSDLGIFSKRTGAVKTPKQEKPAKPFFEGKSPAELEIIIADPSTPPDQKAIAEKAIAGINAAALDRAKNTGAVAAGNAEKKADADLERDVYKRRLKDYEEIHQTATQAGTTIDQLEELSGKVAVPTTGSRVGGYLGREIGSRSQSNPDLTLFDSKAGALAPLVRSMGEKGNLSDSDIKRAMQLIPDKHDTDAVKAQKIAALRDYFGKALGAAGGRLQSPAGSPAHPSVAAPSSGKAQFRWNPQTRTLEPIQ